MLSFSCLVLCLGLLAVTLDPTSASKKNLNAGAQPYVPQQPSRSPSMNAGAQPYVPQQPSRSPSMKPSAHYYPQPSSQGYYEPSAAIGGYYAGPFFNIDAPVPVPLPQSFIPPAQHNPAQSSVQNEAQRNPGQSSGQNRRRGPRSLQAKRKSRQNYWKRNIDRIDSEGPDPERTRIDRKIIAKRERREKEQAGTSQTVEDTEELNDETTEE